MPREVFAGVMSGTSLDGVDAVVADFSPESGAACATLGAAHLALPTMLRDELLALQTPGANELSRAGAAANMLAEMYADAIRRALAVAKLDHNDVVAAGVHGQTLRHRPERGFTLQLNNPARVAERADMTVVADFRSRDVAAGGQGAPLVPAFHAALFRNRNRHRVIVNIGGIANITNLPSAGAISGFDTGPGNALSDLWCARNRGDPFYASDAVDVLVCGGGARNTTLMKTLARELAPRRVASTADEGVPIEHVEALAFAWLARETLAGRAGNLPSVTGAAGPRVLGAIYPR